MSRLLDYTFAPAPDEFRLAIAVARVPGWKAFRKFGMNDAVVSGVSDLWPLSTLRVVPTVAGVASVVSDNAADTDGGLGARTVLIEGLDANFDEISESVALNGLTPATTTLEFFRINTAYITTAGAGTDAEDSEVNKGNITLSIGGEVQAYIEALQGQAHQALHTVPNGKTLLVTFYSAGVGRMGGSSDLHVLGQVKPFGTGWRSISDVYLYNGSSHHNDSAATTIPEKSEVRMRINSTATTQCYGIFGGYLVDNDKLGYPFG